MMILYHSMGVDKTKKEKRGLITKPKLSFFVVENDSDPG